MITPRPAAPCGPSTRPLRPTVSVAISKSSWAMKARWKFPNRPAAARFAPVVTDNFRFVIERTAAKVTPQSWLAELAQVEVFGTDVAQGAAAASAGTTAVEALSV